MGQWREGKTIDASPLRAQLSSLRRHYTCGTWHSPSHYKSRSGSRLTASQRQLQSLYCKRLSRVCARSCRAIRSHKTAVTTVIPQRFALGAPRCCTAVHWPHLFLNVSRPPSESIPTPPPTVTANHVFVHLVLYKTATTCNCLQQSSLHLSYQRNSQQIVFHAQCKHH